jgi:hypothetical protein
MKSFVAEEADGIQYALTALVRLLDWEVPDGEMANLRNLARQEKIVKSIADFRSVLRKALDQKVVSMDLGCSAERRSWIFDEELRSF